MPFEWLPDIRTDQEDEQDNSTDDGGAAARAKESDPGYLHAG